VSDEQTPLSDRELEIVQLVATGATNQQIARELVISVNTVKVHLRNIYTKLDVGSRTEATMVAVRQGWVAVPQLEDAAVDTDAVTEDAPAIPDLPGLARSMGRAPISLTKRIGLVAASLLAILFLFLPQVLQGRTNGPEADPIEGVFPTAPADTSSSRWQPRAQMPTPRLGLAVVEQNGRIYTFGGVSSEGVTARVEIYDPEADAWTTGRSKPTPVGFVSAAQLGDKIYVPGGIDANRQPRDILEIYDPGSDTWTTGASLPEPLGAYALTALNDQLYLFGGRGAQGYVASAYRYDPQAGAWEELPPLEQARGFLGAAALGEQIYVIGGYDDVTEFDTCEAYNPQTGTWASCAPMSVPRGGLAAVAVRDYLFAIGGGMDGYLAFNERYDPRLDAWRSVETPLTAQWRDLGVAFVYPRLYAIGGWNGDFLSVNEAYQALYQLQIILP
jgi:DNA-binding CsgD family transcriptional regulator